MPKSKSIHREAALAAQKQAWEGTLSNIPESELAGIMGISVQMVKLLAAGKNLMTMDGLCALLSHYGLMDMERGCGTPALYFIHEFTENASESEAEAYRDVISTGYPFIERPDGQA